MKKQDLERKIERFGNYVDGNVKIVDIHGNRLKADNLTIKTVKDNYGGLGLVAFLGAGVKNPEITRRTFLKGLGWGLGGLGLASVARVARAEQYVLDVNDPNYYIFRKNVDINSDTELDEVQMIERMSYSLHNRLTGEDEDVDLLDLFKLIRVQGENKTVRWRDQDIPINVFLDRPNAPGGYADVISDAMDEWAQKSNYWNGGNLLFEEVDSDPDIGIKVKYDYSTSSVRFIFTEQGYDFWWYPIKGEMTFNPDYGVPAVTVASKLEFGHGLVLKELETWSNLVMGGASDVHEAEGKTIEYLMALKRGTDMRKYYKE